MQNLKLGVVGFGRMGITHYSILNSFPNVKLNAVADTNSIVLSMLKKYIEGIQTFKDYTQLIDKAEPDALIVSTPPNLHYDILKLALVKGIHVFVEKPYTVSFGEANELASRFRDNKLVNQVGYVNRFNDVFLTVKEHLLSGIIGEPITFKSEMYSGTITRPDKGDGWRGERTTGGGVVYEMAAHAIDLVVYLFGKPKEVKGTKMTKVYSQKANDIVSSTLVYQGGMYGTLNVNWSDESYRKPTNKIEIFGSKGKILADQHSLKVYLKEENSEKGYRKGWNTVYITDIFRQVPFYVRGNEFTRQLRHFVSCIENNNFNTLSSFSDAAITQWVINEFFSNDK